VKDKPPAILTNTNENDFFPLVENPILRFLLYTFVWVIGIALMIVPSAAIV